MVAAVLSASDDIGFWTNENMHKNLGNNSRSGMKSERGSLSSVFKINSFRSNTSETRNERNDSMREDFFITNFIQ